MLTLFGADRVAPSLLAYRSYGMVSVGRWGSTWHRRRAGDGARARAGHGKARREAGAQGKQGVKEFLDGVREGVEDER